MKIGNVVKWWWCLDGGWERTQMQGLIVHSQLMKTDHEKVIVFDVLLTDGTLCAVREDAGLELVA